MGNFYDDNPKYRKLKKALVRLKAWDILELAMEVIFEARMDAIDQLEKRLNKGVKE